MKRMILLAGLVFAVLAATAQDNPYIVKTKGVKKPEKKVVVAESNSGLTEEAEPTDFMGKNFRYYSMCDWKEGMRFMVIPEKYDLLVNTFRDAETNKEVSSGWLRHLIMVYKGHEDMPNGRVHVNFSCEDNNKNYYYELPNGTFDDYCYGKMGVPTLAYLGDVDKARELLLDQTLLTRTRSYRVDTEYDGDGYKDVTVDKNMVVVVKSIGVGTRSFPVKIIVEDQNGNQFYQNVAMSKTNSGLRDDEFTTGNEKYLFQDNIKDYLGKTVHTNHPTSMSSKGSGKVRDIRVPRFTGFIIDEITPVRNSKFFTLTLRETESRRIYYKDVAFKMEDVSNERDSSEEDYFGYLFGMGEGAAKETSKETRVAIREGRVIQGMSIEEVEMAVGEPFRKVNEGDGAERWMYARSNDVILDVWFNERGEVTKAKARKAGSGESVKSSSKKKSTQRHHDGPVGGTWDQGTPLE